MLSKVKDYVEEHREETILIVGIAIGTVLGPQMVEAAYNIYNSLKTFVESRLFKNKKEK